MAKPRIVAAGGFGTPGKRSCICHHLAHHCLLTDTDMEDRYVILKELPGLSGSSWLGVYDGHGGEEAAEFAKNKLHEFVLKQPTLASDRPGALRQAFIEADRAFLALCESKLWDSGTTALGTFISDGSAYTANTGDCRAVLGRRQVCLPLSVDQKPLSEAEAKRIRGAGLLIDKDGRVSTADDTESLAVARSIGDLPFKQNLDLPIELQAITPVPEVSTTQLQPGDFIILASDGLWDVFKSEEAVALISSALGPDFGVTDARLEQLAAQIVNQAVQERGSVDNTSAVIAVIGV